MYVNPENGTPRINYTVAVIGLGIRPWINFTQVDKNGNFLFDASKWPENSTIYLSTIGQPIDGLTFSDHFFSDIPEVPAIYFDHSQLAPIDSFVQEAGIRRVLATQYFDRKMEEAKVSEQVLYDTTCVYPKPDLSYDLNDYIQFNDMAEVIQNILINVHLIESKKGNKLFIYNNKNRDLNRHPVFLINGIPTRDISLVLGLNINEVQRIDLLYEKKSLVSYGIAGFGGIMAIYTRQQVDIPNSMKVDFHGLHSQDNIAGPRKQPGLPDFSPVVYWNPGVTVSSGTGEVQFRLNDLLSDLKVDIRGFDRNGKLIGNSAIIRVKQN